MVKRTTIFISFILLITSGLTAERIQAALGGGGADMSFSPYVLQDARTTISAMAQQADGKLLIGGIFNSVVGVKRNNLARLNPDGTLDPTFNTELGGGEIKQIAPQADGKIIIGGTFYSIGGVSIKDVARLNADGSLDPSFNPGTGLSGYFISLSVQADGKVLVCGFFSTVNGTPRNNFARLNANGSVDTTFNVNAAYTLQPGLSNVSAIAVQDDGEIVIGGYFDRVNGTPRNNIARLNPDGSLDATYTAATDAVSLMAMQPDGKIILAGNFEQVNGTPRTRMARLNTDGSLDMLFAPLISNGSSNNGVASMEVEADGRILVAGFINSVNGTPRNNLARLSADGSLDTTFDPGTVITYPVAAVTGQANGKVFTAGAFTASNGTQRNRLTRLNADASLDDSYALAVGNFSSPASLTVKPDGKIAVCGDFWIINGKQRSQVALLNADGTLDNTFNPGTGFNYGYNNGTLLAIAADSSDRILVGGGFSLANGAPRNNIARLLADGHADPLFNPGAGTDDLVSSIAVQPDGKIVIAGLFSFVNNIARKGIARLNSNGSLDESFNPGAGANLGANKAALQADGKIIITGQFTTINNIPRRGIARLNADGGVDLTFDPGTGMGGAAGTIAVQSDGKIILGGYFTSYNGTQMLNNIVRLNPNGSLDTSFKSGAGTNSGVNAIAMQADGKIILGGAFIRFNGVKRIHVARLNADGTLDGTFNPSSGADNDVGALGLQPDGKIVIIGAFKSINGATHIGIARLFPSAASFDFDGDGKTDVSVFRPSSGTWYSLQSTAGIRATPFGASGDQLAPGDYDGDGKTDTAVFRPSNGYWYFLDSSTGAFRAVQFGANGDIPATGDFDNDGKSDIAVYRPSNNNFYLLYSTDNSFHFQQWGASGDLPVVGDYDGDGKSDFAIFRPSIGTFYVLRSSDGAVVGQQFGQSGDQPIAGDFDGDGRTDFVVFRPDTNSWYILQSSDNGFRGVAWGAPGDVPVAGDYDGDGKWDVAVFRPSSGTFYILQSATNALRADQFGANGDVPVPSAYVP